MKLKSLLAATTACALIAVAPSAKAGDLYVSVFGGLNMLADDSGRISSGPGVWNSDADTGFVLGSAVGTSLERWAEGLRVELEVSYRRNDLGGEWSQVRSGPPADLGDLAGNASTFAILSNVWYEFDIGAKVKPFVGGGIGWARQKSDIVFVDYTSTFEDEASGFAWQLGVGGRYEVANGVDVGISYRFFHGPDISEVFYGEIENDNHAVQVELKIDIQ
jgi:OmpA-OmpF porin, OOP family